MKVKFSMIGCLLRRWFIAWAFFVGLPQALMLGGELQLTTIDGKVIKTTSVKIDPKGKVTAEGLSGEATLDDLSSLVVAGVAVTPAKAPIAVEVRPQGRLLVQDLEYVNEKLKLKWLERDYLLGLEPIAAIRFDPASKNELFETTFAAPIADLDSIFFIGENRKPESLRGLVESLTKSELTFGWENQTRKMDRDVVWGIVFAGTVQPNRSQATIQLRDGSQLSGSIREADDNRVAFELEGSRLDFPWSDVVRIDLRSSRVAFLSDLKPVEAEHQPLLAQPRPWQKDRSAAGKPLRLADREFAKGIGMHSYTKLTFDAGGKFDQLAGIVGLDPAAAGKGDCVVSVLGDGSQLFSQRFRGNDPPADLQINMRGVKQVTLLVETGEGLDLADYINWCDLRLLRQPERNSKP